MLVNHCQHISKFYPKQISFDEFYFGLNNFWGVNFGARYKISKQLANIFNKPTEPFGGINIIMSGDFAQLPPIAGSNALYSNTIQSVVHHTSSVYDQESAIGKAIWHQFTTVVILRSNMRQKNQTDNDMKFRTLLENLRYKSCTEKDIQLLRTRIAGYNHVTPNLSDSNFHNVSIITSWNSYRDKINSLGVSRFSEETLQYKESFYSIDCIKPIDTKRLYKKRKLNTDPLQSSNFIGPNL